MTRSFDHTSARRRPLARTAAAGALLAAVIAGCSSHHPTAQPSPTPSTPSAPSPAQTPSGPVSPLTGLPGEPGRILAVKIDNIVNARPQTGVNSADVVYAIEVEGGISRFLAIYDS